MERVGVTSIWFTRTTETWVRNRPRKGEGVGANAIALCAVSTPETAAAAPIRNSRLL